MSKNYICGGDKYTRGGINGDTIALPVAVVGLPEKITVEGIVLVRKTTFHISLACVGQLVKKYDITISDFVEKVMDDFCAFTQENNVSFVRYRDEFRFAELGERKSIVVMCDVSGLDVFFDLLNTKYGLAFEYQPTHISLYTLQSNEAIFLTNSKDLKERTRIIPRPVEIQNLNTIPQQT